MLASEHYRVYKDTYSIPMILAALRLLDSTLCGLFFQLGRTGSPHMIFPVVVRLVSGGLFGSENLNKSRVVSSCPMCLLWRGFGLGGRFIFIFRRHFRVRGAVVSQERELM